MTDNRIIPPLERATFLIFEDRLVHNLKILAEVQDAADVDIILALKATALWKLFPLVHSYLSGATASSLNEARLITKHMGCKAHSYAPVYRESEIEEYLDNSSHVVFNSLGQYSRFAERAMNREVSIGLRVNPGWSDVEVDKYNPASAGSRLGIAELSSLPNGVEGLHFHVLCESSAQSLVSAWAAFESKFGRYLHQLKWVNLGGGHLITRDGYDKNLLIEFLKSLRAKYPFRIILEPGAAAVWESGVLIAHVEDIVDNGGRRTLMLDTSFTAHMPDTLEMPYYPRVLKAKAQEAEGECDMEYYLGGTSCLAGDFLGPYYFQDAPTIGQQIIFEDMIHYTTVKTTMFNGVTHPDIAIHRVAGGIEVLRRFSFEDYESRMC